MRLLPWLEKKFGRYAVPNLMLYVIVGQVAVIVFQIARQVGVPGGPPAGNHLSLVPARVLEGEVWRIVTFLIDQPAPTLEGGGALSALFLVFYWFILQMMGSALEAVWGVFRFNLFVLTGYLLTIVAAFIGYQIDPEMVASNFFLYSSIFLAFARIFPDTVFRIYFVLPVKVKWLAYIQWASMILILYIGDWSIRVLVLAVILNYFAFFWREHVQAIKYAQRRRNFEAKAGKGRAKLVHTCHTCGLTSQDAPRTAFRYCSQCAGQLCYCPAHLRNHEHVVER